MGDAVKTSSVASCTSWNVGDDVMTSPGLSCTSWNVGEVTSSRLSYTFWKVDGDEVTGLDLT